MPRGCGGEPELLKSGAIVEKIFPADAGVNPVGRLMVEVYDNIPRGCGGEPRISCV